MHSPALTHKTPWLSSLHGANQKVSWLRAGIRQMHLIEETTRDRAKTTEVLTFHVFTSQVTTLLAKTNFFRMTFLFFKLITSQKDWDIVLRVSCAGQYWSYSHIRFDTNAVLDKYLARRSWDVVTAQYKKTLCTFKKSLHAGLNSSLFLCVVNCFCIQWHSTQCESDISQHNVIHHLMSNFIYARSDGALQVDTCQRKTEMCTLPATVMKTETAHRERPKALLFHWSTLLCLFPQHSVCHIALSYFSQ